MFARLADPCLYANGLPCIHDEKLLHHCNNMFAGFSEKKLPIVINITCGRVKPGEQLSLRGPKLNIKGLWLNVHLT